MYQQSNWQWEPAISNDLLSMIGYLYKVLYVQATSGAYYGMSGMLSMYGYVLLLGVWRMLFNGEST